MKRELLKTNFSKVSIRNNKTNLEYYITSRSMPSNKYFIS